MVMQSLSLCTVAGTVFLVVLSTLISTAVSTSSGAQQEALQYSRQMLQAGGGGGGGSVVQQQQQYLVPHNRLRAGLGLPPLKWSAKLAKYAAWYASQRKGDCALVHSDSNYGENIFWGGGSRWQAIDAVNAWAAERRYYDYRSNSCIGRQDCSHYTQMVWRQSRLLGCARLVCAGGDTFITCNYDPHGNVIGQRPF